ncbi:glycosyltransferase family 39 protein [Patescibacteria group bacterium]|nr:glycosyltransferase family 39 protein [Patescibacteria group bacterium]MBU1952909.1 glycosyltransferase family 39 protein [Patescibacteria group bacterium]
MIDTGVGKQKTIKILKSAGSNPLFITVFIYLVSIVIVGCWGNFPSNDDFYYLTQIKTFSNGIFTKSALIGPTFILQGLMGFLWSKFFGLSYISLRVLTILVTIFCIVGLDRVFSVLNVQRKIRTLTLILITFIPQFYVSSLSFMTENYFLFYIIWSLYFFLSYIKTRRDRSLLIACILGGLSIMIRQYGVVLLVAYLIVYVISNLKKINIRKLLLILIPFIVFGCMGLFWPKFKSLGDPKSLNMLLFFASVNLFISRVTSTSVLPYIGYLLLPFTASLFLKQRNYIKIFTLAIALPMSYEFFKIDVFKLRNLFYLEGFYARLMVNIRENLFNNTLFKLFLSYLISVSLLAIAFYLIDKLIGKIKDTKNKGVAVAKANINFHKLTLLLLILGFYVIAVVTDRVFDRYLVNFFIILLIYVATSAQERGFSIHWTTILMTAFICVVTFFLSFHHYRELQLKWKFADKLMAMGVGKYQIFIDNVYARTAYMELINNYDGRYAAKPENYDPICFVQEYVKQQSNALNSLIVYVNNRAFVRKYFANPTVLNAGLLKERSNHFDSTDILMIDEEYPSPVYNLLGKRTFVRAFCTEPIQKVKGI